MKRLALLLVLTAGLLALSGLGPDDRLTARRAVADAAAATAAFGRGLKTRFQTWRADRKAEADGVPVRPAGGSGVILSGTWSPAGGVLGERLGAVMFQHADVRFERGLALHTGPKRIALAREPWSASGLSFARLADAPADAQIEIRRVTGAELAPGLDAGCGPGIAPEWVAIRQQLDTVTLMLFRDEPAPGRTMSDGALCGVGRFDAQG